MVPPEGSKVVRIASGDGTSAKSDAGGHDEGVDSMARLQPVPRPEATSNPGHCLVHRHWANSPSQHEVNPRVTGFALIHLRQDGRRRPYRHAQACSCGKHCADPLGGRRISSAVGQNLDSPRIEHQCRHRLGCSPLRRLDCPPTRGGRMRWSLTFPLDRARRSSTRSSGTLIDSFARPSSYRSRKAVES